MLAVCRTFYYLSPPSQHSKIVRPLLRLLDISPQVERIVLSNILLIAHASPVRARSLRSVILPFKGLQDLFAPYYTHFLVRADDSKQVKADKIQLLRMFINVDNYQALLRDFIVRLFLFRSMHLHSHE